MGSNNLKMRLRMVVLPEPLYPINPTNYPGLILKLILLRTCDEILLLIFVELL
jgi:hypothetical protein